MCKTEEVSYNLSENILLLSTHIETEELKFIQAFFSMMLNIFMKYQVVKFPYKFPKRISVFASIQKQKDLISYSSSLPWCLRFKALNHLMTTLILNHLNSNFKGHRHRGNDLSEVADDQWVERTTCQTVWQSYIQWGLQLVLHFLARDNKSGGWRPPRGVTVRGGWNKRGWVVESAGLATSSFPWQVWRLAMW